MRLQEGRYYGHPNPHRDECVFRDGSFQGVAPLPNYEPPIANLGASRSANGTIEYESSSAHCGALEGDLVIANYSIGDNLTRVELSDDGESVLATSNLVGGFNEPLPLAQDPEGTIYVGEFSSGVVTALMPVDAGCWAEREQGPVEVLDAGWGGSRTASSSRSRGRTPAATPTRVDSMTRPRLLERRPAAARSRRWRTLPSWRTAASSMCSAAPTGCLLGGHQCRGLRSRPPAPGPRCRRCRRPGAARPPRRLAARSTWWVASGRRRLARRR